MPHNPRAHTPLYADGMIEAETRYRRKPGPLQKSCAPCRIQKLRCDRKDGNPCWQCKRRGVECYYGERRRERSGSRSGSGSGSGSEASPKIGIKRGRRGRSRSDTRPLSLLFSTSTPAAISTTAASSTPAAPPTGLPLIKPPSYSSSHSSSVWFDHLLSFFGSKRQASHRMVVAQLNTAFTHSQYYWFDMWHMPTIRRAGSVREEDRRQIHPALVFATVAIGLRQRHFHGRHYGTGPGETLIVDEAFAQAASSDQLSEQIKEAANTYLEQDLSLPDRGMRSWLDTAKAALMLMQLEPEYSPRYHHLLECTLGILRASNLKKALATEAASTTSNRFQLSPLQGQMTGDVSRSSIEMEEAARLALLPLWLGTRLGLAYYGVELRRTGAIVEDVSQSYVFAPWQDGEPEQMQVRSSLNTGGTACREELSNNIRARILGLNVLYNNMRARFLPYNSSYSDPSPDLVSILNNLDDMEFMFAMLCEVVDWDEHSFFRLMMVRFTSSVCLLQGILIRRVGFAHSDSLRGAIVAKMRGEHSPKGANGKGRRLHFSSSIFHGWCLVQQVFMAEMDLDYTAASGQAHLFRLSKVQCETMRFHWRAAVHFLGGVKRALAMAGADEEKDEVAEMLGKTADDLDMRIRRFEAAHASSSSSINSGIKDTGRSPALANGSPVAISTGHDIELDVRL